MRSGDRVRFLHSKGEGIVRKVIDARTVEVEIEDGFLIPTLKSDLVIVSSDESSIAAGESTSRTSQPIPVQTNGGLWLSFVPFNDKTFSVYLVNDTSSEVLFTVGEENAGTYNGTAAGVLKPGTSFKFTEASTVNFEEWPAWIIQALQFREGSAELKQPLTKKMQFKASSFFKGKQTIPVLGKEGHAFRIDAGTVKVDTARMTENMFTSSTEDTVKISRPAKEVDLHIEKLVNDRSGMSNSQILKLQMETFEKNLDNAIASGMDEIIFIHGTGNGVLRDQIHKSLSKNKLIKFFQDARKEKFGYGATLVRLK